MLKTLYSKQRSENRTAASIAFSESCVQFEVYFIPGYRMVLRGLQKSPHIWAGPSRCFSAFSLGRECSRMGRHSFRRWWTGHWEQPCIYNPVLSAAVSKPCGLASETALGSLSSPSWLLFPSPIVLFASSLAFLQVPWQFPILSQVQLHKWLLFCSENEDGSLV